MHPTCAQTVVALLLAFLAWVPSARTEIIPAAHAPVAVWAAAGVPGGIPTNRTVAYRTFAPTATGAEIQDAINTCPPGQIVLLEAGTFNLGNLRLYSPSNWVLRGAGMGRTILNLSGGSANIAIGGYPPWGSSWLNTVAIVSGGAQGSTSVVVANPKDYAAGDLCLLDMENAGWIVGYGTGNTGNPTTNGDSAGKGRDGNRVQLHIVELTAVNGNELRFWPPLPFTLDTARNPQISEFGGRGPRWSGIEDLTLHCGGESSAGFFGGGLYAFWLKNVEVTNWGTFGVWPRWSACFEMRGCYVHEPAKYDWGRGYALQMDPCSGSLVVDNIFFKNQDTVLLQGGCAGNVLAYNFLSFSYNGYIGIDWLLQEAGVNHTPFPCFNLFEGNYIGKLQPDYYYGPSGYGTVLRNRITGNGPWITQNRVAVSIDARQRYYSIVGNQLGERTAPASITLAKPFTLAEPGVTLPYAQPGAIAWGYDPGSRKFGYFEPHIYRLGYPNSGNNDSGTGLAVHDDFVKTNTLRHGNWDAAHNEVVWDTAIADTNVPQSLFLSRRPDWFGNLAWPPYGPVAPSSTVDDIARIPAGYRLLYNQDPPPATYATWRAASFGADATNDAIAGPLADPDGAGLSNYARYAFNLPSRGPVAVPVKLDTVTADGTTYLRLTFPRRTVASDVSYIVESSPDLFTWTPVSGLTFLPGADPVVARDVVSIGASPRRFLRVQVTTP